MEALRIENLKKFQLLDTPPDGSFDAITELASKIFGVPISIISLVDTDRIWFKSRYGLTVNEIGRDPGLCSSAILSDDVYIVEDARKDPRTLANPLVAGEFGLQFYAAAPLTTSDHYNLGTLCIIDKSPRQLTEKEQEILRSLGKLVITEMERRMQLRNSLIHLRNLAGDLENEVDETIDTLKQNQPDDREKIISYLDSTRLFLSNIREQLSLESI